MGDNQGKELVRPKEQTVRHLRRCANEGHRHETFPNVWYDEVSEKSFYQLIILLYSLRQELMGVICGV